MRKVFLYLYPIKEYITSSLLPDDDLYDIWNIERPLPILNECIQKRYRDNGFDVIFVLFSDKEIYGINNSEEDRTIRTDVSFDELNATDNEGKDKENFIPKYAEVSSLLKQVGEVDYLVVSGFHIQDCVKKVATFAHECGISTLIDIDLTEHFFYLYKQKDYFCIDNYNPIRYKDFVNTLALKLKDERLMIKFIEEHKSPIYGLFSEEDIKIK